MSSYNIQTPIVDEKMGYERHPIGGGKECCDDETTTDITAEILRGLWKVHFEPLLHSADTHNPALLAQYNADTEGYIKAIV